VPAPSSARHSASYRSLQALDEFQTCGRLSTTRARFTPEDEFEGKSMGEESLHFRRFLACKITCENSGFHVFPRCWAVLSNL
jgi:hypothetical protein